MLYIVPSFLSGNISILKPSSLSPAIGLELEQIFDEKAIDNSVVSLLLRTSELPEFVQSVDINTLAFQGSHWSGNAVHDTLDLGLDTYSLWDLDNHTIGIVCNQGVTDEMLQERAEMVLHAAFRNSG